MQKVAAYLLERREEVESSSKRKDEVRRLSDLLDEWLVNKGAQGLSGKSGTFVSRDLEATFRREKAIAGERSWQLLSLSEINAEGRRFNTSVSITNTGSIIAVYVSLEAGLVYSAIAPLSIQPRCPRFLRQMLDLDDKWYHGPTKYHKTTRLIGEEQGQWIAKLILDKTRTLPIILISEDYGEILLPKLDKDLSFELAGLASIFVLDHDASWGVTEILGKSLSCYWGAVRLYWPNINLDENPVRHPVWTANTLLVASDSLSEAGQRFREQLRRILMQVSAVSVLRPREIDDIRSECAKQQIAVMQNSAASVDEYCKLAEEYESENKRLRVEIEQLVDELDKVQTQLANEQTIHHFQSQRTLDIEPEPDVQVERDSPKDGDIRFYKKVRNNGRYDIMERFLDCGHKKWQSATKAEQAKRGIAHFEGSRDWKNLWHCGTCQGGGVWKVKW